MTPHIIDTHVDFHEVRSEPGKLVFDYKQDIPAEFISDLKKTKIESTGKREGEFQHVAAIPVVVHEKWLREGFDCTKEDIRATVKKLHAEGLDAFLVSNKRI